MRRSNADVAKRRNALIAHLEDCKRATILELASLFDVSQLTIRRDVDYLEKQGVLSRDRGQIELHNPFGRPSGSKQMRSIAAIARAAARLVDDGDCIFLNTSSTAMLLISHITAGDVTIVTNNGKALMLNQQTGNTIILTGGEIRANNSSMTGDIALDCLSRITAAKCFLGVTGICAPFGLTSATSPEPAVNKMMMQRSKAHIVLADSSKIGFASNFKFANAADVDLLITDNYAQSHDLEDLCAAGLKKVITVDPSLDEME